PPSCATATAATSRSSPSTTCPMVPRRGARHRLYPRPHRGARLMAEKRIGIIMHGITGRMGMNQHLIRSILEIRKQGGVSLKDGTRLMPDPLLVGRNAAKVEELARKHGVQRWTADLDAALKGPDQIF